MGRNTRKGTMSSLTVTEKKCKNTDLGVNLVKYGKVLFCLVDVSSILLRTVRPVLTKFIILKASLCGDSQKVPTLRFDYFQCFSLVLRVKCNYYNIRMLRTTFLEHVDNTNLLCCGVVGVSVCFFRCLQV